MKKEDVKKKIVKGKVYLIKVSHRKHKKYDVYRGEDYITSFGDNRFQHYKDRIGYYATLDHKDKSRRALYRMRHVNDNTDDPNYAGFWSWNYLW